MQITRRHAAARLTTLAASVPLVLLGACGGNDSGDEAKGSAAAQSSAEPASAPTEPCDVTEPAVVQKAFGGTVADEKPGPARDCEYAITGGAADTVHVFYYGTAAEFDGIKSGYAANRGTLSDIAGVGDHAFSPGDVGANEIVALKGDTVFAVSVGAISADSVTPEVKTLAGLIANDLG
jgi:hypothetical protein